MGDEADRLYNEEIDYMVRMDMLAEMDEEMLQTIDGEIYERREISIYLDNTSRIDLMIPSPKADDKEVYANYFGKIYDQKMNEKAAKILKEAGFSLTNTLKNCEFRIENYKYDVKRMLDALVKYDCRQYKVQMALRDNGTSVGCAIKFNRFPLPKFKKRLNDFGFHFSTKHEAWLCIRGKRNPKCDYKDVASYFEKQEQVQLIR